MRQRRLRRGADDAGDVPEVVGKCGEQRDVADRRRSRGGRVDGGQHAEALAGVQRDVGDVREQLARGDAAHAELVEQRAVLREQRLLGLTRGVVRQPRRGERHRRADEVEGQRDVARADRIGGPELQRVEPGLASARRLEAVVGDDRAGEVRAIVAEVRDRVEVAVGDPQAEPVGREVPVVLEGLRVDEVQLRRRRVDAEDQQLALPRRELAGDVVAAREQLERRAVGDAAGAGLDRQLRRGCGVRGAAHAALAQCSPAPQPGARSPDASVTDLSQRVARTAAAGSAGCARQAVSSCPVRASQRSTTKPPNGSTAPTSTPSVCLPVQPAAGRTLRAITT